MNRREFLVASASAVLAPKTVLGQSKALRPSVTRQNLVGAAHPATEIWGYNASVPGPELRFRQGQRLRAEVENALPAPTTVHWHGIRLPNAMDGVPGLTQAPIAAGGGKFVLRIRSSRRRHVLVPPAPRRRRAARARTVRRVDRRGARPTGGRPRRGVDPVGLAPRSRSRPAPGLCERDGREPCRPDRKHRHRERRDSGGIYRQKRRTAAASADQRIERAHLRSQLRGPRALGDRARRAPGSAALVPARGARARDARRPDPRLYRRPGQPPPRGGRLLPMVAPTSS